MGRITGTDVCVAYIKEITNPKIVDEVKKRLGRIDIDGVLESGYIRCISSSLVREIKFCTGKISSCSAARENMPWPLR